MKSLRRNMDGTQLKFEGTHLYMELRHLCMDTAQHSAGPPMFGFGILLKL